MGKIFYNNYVMNDKKINLKSYVWCIFISSFFKWHLVFSSRYLIRNRGLHFHKSRKYYSKTRSRLKVLCWPFSYIPWLKQFRSDTETLTPVRGIYFSLPSNKARQISIMSFKKTIYLKKLLLKQKISFLIFNLKKKWINIKFISIFLHKLYIL